MQLLETLKRTFLKQPEPLEFKVHPKKIEKELTPDDDFTSFRSFFDDSTTLWGGTVNTQQAYAQADKINLYRRISEYPEVADAIDEIIDEITYSPELADYVDIEIDTTNKKLDDTVKKSFQKILKLMNTDRNFYYIIRQSYIDGQLNLFLDYDETGIIDIKYLDPRFLLFDFNDNLYRYIDEPTMTTADLNSIEIQKFNIEQVLHVNYGHRDKNKLITSMLERAIKPANQLRTLEDLLIPLRFSRSVSRRVFNVDVADLPTSKAETEMRRIQENFKYKKFYNAETGEVTNQQHITSMVEDYWFANRNGQKGTTVDLLDESGNLGELGDIKYIYKKLYRSLGIPTNRMPDAEEAATFDYDATQITKEDMKFYLMVNRIRTIYIKMFMDLLKRDLVSNKLMTEPEFDSFKEHIKVYFIGDNIFLERMKLANFNKRIEVYSSARDYSGSLFSVQYLYKNIFKFTDDEIKQMMKEIESESRNPLFKHLYEPEDPGF